MFEYSEGVGRIITIDDRDYFILIPTDRDNRDLINQTYQMVYKDSAGKLQRRKFVISVRYADGMSQSLTGLNDAPVFSYIANNEMAARNFITFLCFGRDNSFVIEQYRMSPEAQVMSRNVIVYVNPIQ